MSIGTVTTHLNLRSGPGTEFAVVAVLAPQTKVTVVEAQGEWLKIETPSGNGFANGKFILRESDSIDPRIDRIGRGRSSLRASRWLQTPR